MKKGRLLNADISALIARLGHTDTLVISDAGLPIAASTTRIDLALTQGVPGFLPVLEVVTSEMQVQTVVLACEMQQHNPQLHASVLAQLDHLQCQQGNQIAIHYVSHQHFKQQIVNSRAVIRTGECSPYANILLEAGVTF